MNYVKYHHTAGSIARQLGVALHRVNYVIASRGIEPVGKAGNAWVYSDEQVGQIRRHLEYISDARASRWAESEAGNE